MATVTVIQAWLPTAGVWYYKARDFDPELGRFLQADPIGYKDSPNLYAYVLNDPVNATDPLGLECIKADVCITGKRLDGHESAPSLIGMASFSAATNRGTPNGAGKEENEGEPITVVGERIKKRPAFRTGFLNRIYRLFVPDPCRGQGSNERGTSGGYDPYNLPAEAVVTGVAVALGKHGPGASGSEFNSYFSDPANLTSAIGSVVQTNPIQQSLGRYRYTVDLGRIVGYDRINGGTTNYLTVTVRVRLLRPLRHRGRQAGTLRQCEHS